MQRPRRLRARLGACIALALLVSVDGGGAQDPPAVDRATLDGERTFGEEASVVAVDVLVGSARASRWVHLEPRLPAAFDPTELAIRVGGEPRPLVGAEALRDGRPIADDSWRLVLAFDLLTGRRQAARAAAAWLAQRAQALVALGRVEVVAFDPEARRLTPPLDDAERLGEVLSSLALQAETGDSTETRRLAFDDAAAAGRVTAFGAAAAVAAEVEEARALHDRLLVHLESLEPATTRRAVLWIGPGLSPAPAQVYLAGLDGETRPEETILREAAVDPLAELESVGRALAGLGWIVYPMQPPPPDASRGRAHGWRLGKLRVARDRIAYEAEREPERAEALLELADARRRTGELEGAVEAYERAIHHFFGDQRTATRQIVAWDGLADALEALGRASQARDARLAADDLRARVEAGQAARGPKERNDKPPAAVEMSPHDPRSDGRAILARATGGLTVETAAQLEAVLVDLALRVRLTYQLEGRLDVPRPLEVARAGDAEDAASAGDAVDDGDDRGDRGDREVRAPQWTRAASDPRLDSALRRRSP